MISGRRLFPRLTVWQIVLPVSGPSEIRMSIRISCLAEIVTGNSASSCIREANGQAAWDLFIAGFGPTKTIAATLEPGRRAEFTRDFIEYHEHFRGELGIAMPREYLVTVGVKR